MKRESKTRLDLLALEKRDTPSLAGTANGPVPLAISGPTTGIVSLYASLNSNGQYNGNPAATVDPFPGEASVVRTAFADVNGDGIPDLIAITGPGVPVRYTIISGTNYSTVLVPPTNPFGDANYTGGGFVAAGTITANGRAQFAFSPDEGGGPRVVIFQLSTTNTPTQIKSFYGINDSSFRGGARIAIGDVNHDGFADLVVAAGFGGGPRVAIYNGVTLLTSTSATPPEIVPDFYAFGGTDATNLTDGVYVAVGDLNADNYADLIFGAGPGGAPRILALDSRLLISGSVTEAEAAPLANFYFGDPASRGGVRVAAKQTLGFGSRSEIVAGSGENLPSEVQVYYGLLSSSATAPTPSQMINPYSKTLADGVYVG